jgi:hypothetical protein
MFDMSGPHQGAIDKLQEWRNKYSKKEYPEKVLINLFYDVYAMDGIWPQIENCFSGTQRFSDYNQALSYVIGLKRKYQVEVLRPRLLQMMSADQAVGNVRPSNWADKLKYAQSGDDGSVIELEYSYWYYFQYWSATLNWAALGLLGLDKHSAFLNTAGGHVRDLRLSSFSDALHFFPAILGIEFKCKDIEGNRIDAVSSGCKKVYPDSFTILPKWWGHQRFQGDTELMIATRNEDLAKIRRLVDSGVDVDERGASFMTPLHVTTYQRHLEIVRFLLARGADIDAIDEDKETPLYSAASATAMFLPEPYVTRPLAPIVQMLLEAGSRPDAFSCLYMTPANATDDPVVREMLVKAEQQYYTQHPDAAPVDAKWGKIAYDNEDLAMIAGLNRASKRHLPVERSG